MPVSLFIKSRAIASTVLSQKVLPCMCPACRHLVLTSLQPCQHAATFAHIDMHVQGDGTIGPGMPPCFSLGFKEV